MIIHNKFKDDDQIHKRSQVTRVFLSPLVLKLVLTLYLQTVPTPPPPTSFSRTIPSKGSLKSAPVEGMMSKQISIQQQFQLVTDEDDEDEISLKVLLIFTPTFSKMSRISC